MTARLPRTALLPLLALLTLLAPPLLANGGTVRISRAPLGPYLVTIYSSPTPLRTGEVDISVLVQDSTDAVLAPAIMVEALPRALTEGATADSIRREATRAQATNKLFQAAKFDVAESGEWEFRVEVDGAGSLSFRTTVVRSTLLDRPYLLGLLILLPVLVIGWLALGREEHRASNRSVAEVSEDPQDPQENIENRASSIDHRGPDRR